MRVIDETAEAPRPAESSASARLLPGSGSARPDELDAGQEPEGAFLAGLTVDAPEGAGELDGAGDAEASAPAVIGREEFHGLFVGMFNIASHVPPGIRALAIRPEEEEAARGASSAIYDIAEETPALRFLIEPGNVWIQRAVAIGMFGAVKGRAVTAELRERRAAAAARTERSRAKQPEVVEGPAEPAGLDALDGGRRPAVQAVAVEA